MKKSQAPLPKGIKKFFARMDSPETKNGTLGTGGASLCVQKVREGASFPEVEGLSFTTSYKHKQKKGPLLQRPVKPETRV